MTAPSPGKPGSRGRGRGAQRKTRRDEAGQLPGGESAVRPREARFKGSGSCADGSPRPPGTAPPLSRRAPALAPPRVPACRPPAGRVCVPSPSLRSVDTVSSSPWEAVSSLGAQPLPAASAPTNLELWNPVELSRLPAPPAPNSHFPGARPASARAPRCGAVRSGWCVPLAGVSREEGGVLRSDCCTKPQRNKPGTQGPSGHLLCAPRLTQKQVNASSLAN